MQIVKVTVSDTDGSFDVDLTGFHGQGCDAIIDAFGELGAVTSHVHKPEFKQTVNTTRKVATKQ